MNAKFSIAMCTYNGSRFLREQLESIAAQTRPPDELVICDDASSDSTVEIIKAFTARARFPVPVFVNQQNFGSTRNFEKAVELCSGELIALADQDDVWQPEKLELIEAEFERRPDVGLLFSDAEIVNENLETTGRRMWHEVGFRKKEQQLVRKGRALEVLLPGWSVTGASLAFRSSFRDLVLPIPPDIPMIHDGWIALMIAAVSTVEFIEQPLILYRQHAQQQIGAPDLRPHDRGRLKNLARLKEDALRANTFSSLVRTIELVKERLDAEGLSPTWQKNRDDLDARFRHMQVRMDLPAGFFARLSAVLKELTARRYHRYANGAASAAKDLIYGARGN